MVDKLVPGYPRRRTRTGCLTCRKRKIKCDETKPSCQKCRSTGRRCDGYSSTWQTGLVGFLVVLRNPGVPEFEAKAEQALQFFCEVSGPSLTNFGSAGFWNRLVLQACHAESSIKHLAIAVSTLDHQERMTAASTKPVDSSASDRLFLQHYGFGLKLLTAQSQQNVTTEIILISCLLLVVCEELRNNAFASIQHVVAGRKIISDYCETAVTCRTKPNTTMQELGSIFRKLGYSPGDCDIENKVHNRAGVLFGQPRPTVPGDRFDMDDCELPIWTSLEMGADELRGVVARCMQPPPRVGPESLFPRTRFQSVDGVSEDLNRWAFNLCAFTAAMDDEDFAERQPQVLLLHCYYLNMTIVSRCVPFRDEALFDGYGPNFQHLFNKASRLLLVQDAPAALAPVLFFIATRCRDPALRRTAASYLCQCSWEGIRLSTIADQIIKLEQRGIAHIVTCSGDVPQERRVVVTDVSFSDDSVCTLHLIRPSRCNPSETLYYSFKWVDVHDDAAVTSSITQLLQRTLRFELLSLN